jgi:hypothetical protein
MADHLDLDDAQALPQRQTLLQVVAGCRQVVPFQAQRTEPHVSQAGHRQRLFALPSGVAEGPAVGILCLVKLAL